MKKLLILLSLLCSIAPVCAAESTIQKPYVVDLYTAVKNNTGLLSYFIWHTSAEKAAVKAAEAAGESKPAVYLEAAEYAYEMGDAATAATLKQQYATGYLFSLPVTAAICALSVAGYKLAQHRLRYIRNNSCSQQKMDDLRTRIPAYKAFNEELKDMNEPQIEPKGFPEQKEISTAFRKLALRWHPDKNHGNEARATEKFRKIHDAYKILNKKSGDDAPPAE